MFKTITARFPGTCRRCHEAIVEGQTIRWAKGAGSYHLLADCPANQAEIEERQNLAYWERVDNYRELGYDPNAA